MYSYMFDAILAKQHSLEKKLFLALCFRYSQSRSLYFSGSPSENWERHGHGAEQLLAPFPHRVCDPSPLAALECKREGRLMWIRSSSPP